MARKSMAKTSPEKIKIIDDKNPENRDVQSAQKNTLNESAYESARKMHSNR